MEGRDRRLILPGRWGRDVVLDILLSGIRWAKLLYIYVSLGIGARRSHSSLDRWLFTVVCCLPSGTSRTRTYTSIEPETSTAFDRSLLKQIPLVLGLSSLGDTGASVDRVRSDLSFGRFFRACRNPVRTRTLSSFVVDWHKMVAHRMVTLTYPKQRPP